MKLTLDIFAALIIISICNLPSYCQTQQNWVDGQLIEYNKNGAWCWFQDERVVVDTVNSKLVIGSAANGGGVDVVIYDIKNQKIDSKTQIGKLTSDDHNAPGLLVQPKSGGYIAMFADHYDKYCSRYCIFNGEKWSSEKQFDWTKFQVEPIIPSPTLTSITFHPKIVSTIWPEQMIVHQILSTLMMKVLPGNLVANLPPTVANLITKDTINTGETVWIGSIWSLPNSIHAIIPPVSFMDIFKTEKPTTPKVKKLTTISMIVIISQLLTNLPRYFRMEPKSMVLPWDDAGNRI